MPIQRIPRIILLLGELQRKTPDTHPDKDLLGQAIESLDEVMNYLDKDITSEEFRAKFLNMGKKFKGGNVSLKSNYILSHLIIIMFRNLLKLIVFLLMKVLLLLKIILKNQLLELNQN